MTTSVSPDSVLAQNDPGDDIGRRFRFQWTWAAIACCSLMDKTQNISEVFCEHHEDILVKHTDKSFTGIQVKTAAENQAPWMTSDEAVRKSCARFCQLEEKFPTYFSAYKFVTNHTISSSKNGKDLKYVLGEIFKAKSSPTPLARPIAGFLNAVAKLANCDLATARRALEKTTAVDSLPKLADVEMRLITTLTSNGLWPRALDLLHAAIKRAAGYLIYECGRAASLAHEDLLPAYLPLTLDSVDIEKRRCIEGKRIDIQRLLDALEYGLNETLPLNSAPENLPKLGKGSPAL